VIEKFYGRHAAESYFVGCSTGGRQALMEATRFPEDFDGIIAGAPAWRWTYQMTGAIWNTLPSIKDASALTNDSAAATSIPNPLFARQAIPAGNA